MSRDNPSISFLIATIGRPTLKNTLASLKDQIIVGHDRIYCIFDGICQGISLKAEADALGDSLKFILHPENLGHCGHGLRNIYQTRLEGDYIHNMDDDDVYLPDTISQVRDHLKNNFGKMVITQFYGLDNRIVGDKHLIGMGQVGTPSGFLPNVPEKFPNWPIQYGGDADFYMEISKHLEYVFVDLILIKTFRYDSPLL